MEARVADLERQLAAAPSSLEGAEQGAPEELAQLQHRFAEMEDKLAALKQLSQGNQEAIADKQASGAERASLSDADQKLRLEQQEETIAGLDSVVVGLELEREQDLAAAAEVRAELQEREKQVARLLAHIGDLQSDLSEAISRRCVHHPICSVFATTSCSSVI